MPARSLRFRDVGFEVSIDANGNSQRPPLSRRAWAWAAPQRPRVPWPPCPLTPRGPKWVKLLQLLRLVILIAPSPSPVLRLEETDPQAAQVYRDKIENFKQQVAHNPNCAPRGQTAGRGASATGEPRRDHPEDARAHPRAGCELSPIARFSPP